MSRRRSAHVAPVLLPLPDTVQPWHAQAMDGGLDGLPEGMRNAPRPQQPFHKKPDGLERMAALWRPAALAQRLHEEWSALPGIGYGQASPDERVARWHERLNQALFMVLRQIPERVTVWSDRIGQRMEIEQHPFCQAERDAQQQCLDLLLAYAPRVNGLVLGTAAEHLPGWFARLLAQAEVPMMMYGSPLLNHLAGTNRAWALPLVVTHGVNLDAIQIRPGGDVDVLGETALGSTARHGHQEACEVLLTLGADPRIANARGLSPSEVARAHGHTACAGLLVEHEQRWWRREMDVDTRAMASTPDARRRARL